MGGGGRQRPSSSTAPPQSIEATGAVPPRALGFVTLESAFAFSYPKSFVSEHGGSCH